MLSVGISRGFLHSIKKIDIHNLLYLWPCGAQCHQQGGCSPPPSSRGKRLPCWQKPTCISWTKAQLIWCIVGESTPQHLLSDFSCIFSSFFGSEICSNSSDNRVDTNGRQIWWITPQNSVYFIATGDDIETDYQWYCRGFLEGTVHHIDCMLTLRESDGCSSAAGIRN